MRRVVLAAVLVATGALCLRLRWRRTLRDALHLPFALLALLALLPLNLWDDFIGGVHDIEDKVKHLVSVAVNLAVGWIKAFIDDAKAGFDNLFEWVGAIGAAVAKLSVDVAQGIGHGISSAVSSVSDWVGRAIGDIQHWVGQAIRDVTDWVGRGLHDLGNLIDSVWAAVQRDVWAPLKGLIDGVWNWVQEHLIPMVLGWVADVRQWAKDGLKWLSDIVGGVWDWVERFAKPLLSLLGKAERFLLFVVAHPLDWWLVAIEDIVGKAPGYLIGLLTSGAEHAMGSVEELAAKWIG